MRKSAYAGLAAAAVVAVVASGCTTSAPSDEKVELTFINAHPGFFDGAIELFEADHPNITINQQTVPFNDMNTQIQSVVGAGDPSIDVLAADGPRIPAMATDGLLMDVSVDRDTILAATSQTALDSVTWDGAIYSYPQSTSDGELFYNIAALEAAGIPLPGADPADRLTWEQVLQYGAAAQAAGAVKYAILFDQVDRYYQLQPLLMSMGAGSGLMGEGNLEPAVNTPEWKAFGEWYSKVHTDGLAPRGIEPEQMPATFANGEAAFYLANSAQVSAVQSGPIKDGWGVAPFPYFEGGPIVTPTDAWTIGVSPYTEHADEAREFARYLTLDPIGAARGVTDQGSFPPVATGAMQAWSDKLAGIAPPGLAEEISALVQSDLQYAEHRPSSIGYLQFETILNKAFSDIRNGGDPSAILDDAQAQLEREFGRL